MVKHKKYIKKHIINVFVGAFINDPVYISYIKDSKKRKRALKYFFRAYLRMLKSTCYLWSENDCFAFVYDPSLKPSKFRLYLDYFVGYVMGMPMMLFVGIKGYHKILKEVLFEGSDWLESLDNFIHLDMLVVDPAKRGMGFGKQMMQYIFEEADRRQKKLTLETQSVENRDMYQHFDFEMYKMIHHEAFIEYCMIRKCA